MKFGVLTLWMLIVLVSEFVGCLPGKCRHEHSIIVHKSQPFVRYDDVVVLQIAVGNTMSAQVKRQLFEVVSQKADGDAVLIVCPNKFAEGGTLDPLHLENWIPLAVNLNTLVQILKWDSARHVIREDEFGYGGVALVLIGNMLEKAPHCHPAVLALKAEDACEPAGHAARQPKRIRLCQSIAQLAVAKAASRSLNCLKIVLR